jgi:acetyl-CoA carboxylase biotin carboxyl carrier protein
VTIKVNDITAIIEMFAASEWGELHVEMEGLHLFLSTDPNARLVTGSAAVSYVPAPVAAAPAAAAPAPAAAPAAAAPAKPGSPPFVEIGQAVDVDTEVCLLEVMKLFTAVKAGVKGTVRQICVADADLVEGEQILFYVEP